ncbi:MAG: peptidoglycan-binding protein [Fusobacteriaceae bacterium]
MINFKKPTFTLLNKMVPFVFVVPPVDLSLDHGIGMEYIDIIDLGEVVFTGEKKAIKISFSGFFPNVNSNFYSFLNPMPPGVCVELLKKFKNDGAILKFIVPEWGRYISCKIEVLREYTKDHTGDIYYELTLVEETGNQSILDTVTGLYKRLT